MILFFTLAACIYIAHLPSCESKDPLTWVSVEAQGAYLISDTDSGQKCGAIPNTFEMRADGTWLPSTEFDLTGNFEDDCGLHVSLSIPAQGGEKEVTSEWEELFKQRKALREKIKQLKAGKKAYEERKRKHQEEVRESERARAADIEEENKRMAEKKEEVKKVEDRVAELRKTVEKKNEDNEKLKKSLEKRKEDAKEGRKGLEDAEAAHENETKGAEEELKSVAGKLEDVRSRKKLLKKIYDNCAKPKDTSVDMIIPDSLRRDDQILLLCLEKKI